jgi:hypothetical protein
LECFWSLQKNRHNARAVLTKKDKSKQTQETHLQAFVKQEFKKVINAERIG